MNFAFGLDEDLEHKAKWQGSRPLLCDQILDRSMVSIFS